MGTHVAETYTPDEYTTNLRKAAALGATVVRVPVDWAALEPDSGALDTAYVTEIDGRLKEAGALGMGVVLMFAQSPEWASGDSNPAYPPLPERVGAYASALKRLYLSLSDEARSSVMAFEIWNEPNSVEFWPRYGTPRSGTYVLVPIEAAYEYAQLLRAAYDTLKSVAPDVPVLGGSLASADVEYLRALLDTLRSGYLPMDGLSLHPYTRVDERPGSHYGYAQYPDQCNEEDPLSPPWCFEKGIENVRALLDLSGYHHVGIWITEFGVSSADGWGDAGSETEQEKHLDIALRLLKRNAVYWKVKVAIWYRLKDEGSDRFGLLREDLSPKPAASRFQRGFF